MSRTRVRNHINKVHKLSEQACTDSYRPVQLQSWYPGSRAQYWIVKAKATALVTPAALGLQKQGKPSYDSDAELAKLEQQEIQRLEQLEQDCIAQEAELEDSNNTPWLRWTEWPAQFRGLPLDIITASAIQPEKKALKSDYVLGTLATGEHLVSPVADEAKLQQLVQLLDAMFDCCNQTVTATPHLLRCWLHSYSPDKYFPKPFTLLGKPQTQQRYRALWKQFICFAFRAWKTSSINGLQQ